MTILRITYLYEHYKLRHKVWCKQLERLHSWQLIRRQTMQQSKREMIGRIISLGVRSHVTNYHNFGHHLDLFVCLLSSWVEKLWYWETIKVCWQFFDNCLHLYKTLNEFVFKFCSIIHCDIFWILNALKAKTSSLNNYGQRECLRDLFGLTYYKNS